jgi:hypothetical protein
MLENNLLEFDPEKSRLGFSYSLLFRQTNCNNFHLATNRTVAIPAVAGVAGCGSGSKADWFVHTALL